MFKVKRSFTAEDDYTVISVDAAQDARLSFGARGLLAEMASMPDGWRHSAERIAASSRHSGRTQVRAYMRELENAGYIIRAVGRLSNGQIDRRISVSDEVRRWQTVDRAEIEAAWRDIDVAPVETEPERPKRRPAKDGMQVLYRFYDEDGALLYIGITNGLKGRVSHHRKNKSWWPEVASMVTEEFPSRAEVLDAERAAIKAERPRYNIRHNKAACIEENGQLEDWLIDEGLAVVESVR